MGERRKDASYKCFISSGWRNPDLWKEWWFCEMVICLRKEQRNRGDKIVNMRLNTNIPILLPATNDDNDTDKSLATWNWRFGTAYTQGMPRLPTPLLGTKCQNMTWLELNGSFDIFRCIYFINANTCEFQFKWNVCFKWCANELFWWVAAIPSLDCLLTMTMTMFRFGCFSFAFECILH